MEFSRQEYWSGLWFPSPGDLANPGIEPQSPALQADSLPSELPGCSPSPLWAPLAKLKKSFKAGVPSSWATDQYWSWPVRNWATEQEVSGGKQQVKLHLYLQLLPVAHIAQPPVTSVTALGSHRSMISIVNYTCEGSRLLIPYENHPKTIPLPPHPTQPLTVVQLLSRVGLFATP